MGLLLEDAQHYRGGILRLVEEDIVGGDYRAVGIGFAAALSMGLCVLGSGYAVGRVGAAAMGAAAEKPELLIRSLLFVALAADSLLH